jgi:hypothetical protein
MEPARMLVALILLSTVWAPVPQPGGRLAAAEPLPGSQRLAALLDRRE